MEAGDDDPGRSPHDLRETQTSLRQRSRRRDTPAGGFSRFRGKSTSKHNSIEVSANERFTPRLADRLTARNTDIWRMTRRALITAENVSLAASEASSLREILLRLGVATSSRNYSRLQAVANAAGIQLPTSKGTVPRRAQAGGRKRSWTDEALIEAVERGGTITEVTRHLGLSDSRRGDVSQRAKELGLTFSRRNSPSQDVMLARRHARAERVLRLGHARVNGQRLRRLLTEHGILEDKCNKCSLGPSWQDVPLALQVNHVNGDHRDNRAENLEILCPNCHSQTDTYAGRNKNK